MSCFVSLVFCLVRSYQQCPLHFGNGCSSLERVFQSQQCRKAESGSEVLGPSQSVCLDNARYGEERHSLPVIVFAPEGFSRRTATRNTFRPLLLHHQPFPVLPLLMRASAHTHSSPPLFQEGGQNLPILFLLISIFLGRVRWHEALCSPRCQSSPQLVHYFSLSSSRFGVCWFICSPSLTLCLIGKYLVLHNTMASRGNTIYIIWSQSLSPFSLSPKFQNSFDVHLIHLGIWDITEMIFTFLLYPVDSVTALGVFINPQIFVFVFPSEIIEVNC